MVKLSFAGAVLEPKAAGLVMAWITALEARGLGELAHLVRRQVFEDGQAIVRDCSNPDRHVWRLTLWGELTLCELVSIAARPGLSPPMRRERILSALVLAGYDGKEPTTA